MQSTNSEHHLLQNLNTQQKEAVVHINGPLLILAGAGSGKTTVITRRIAWLIEKEGVDPGSILAMTFTNKAAEEMSERVIKLVGTAIERPWVSTFHRFCTFVLRQEGETTPVGRDFVIFDPSDQRSLIKRVLTDLGLTEKDFHPKKVMEIISDFKSSCLLPQEAMCIAHDMRTKKILNIYDKYQERLTNNHACDFDDLLLYTERLFRNESIQTTFAKRFRYILVDEYQDTNKAQYLLIQHLARKYRNLCVVGDEDQSIYGWRGADINNIFNFKKDFPETIQIKLEQNYRSTQKILYAASEIIANNKQRIGKTLWTDRAVGNNVILDILSEGRLEAEFVAEKIQEERCKQPESHIAVLYRANWQSRQMEEALRNKNMTYRLVGGTKFYERQEVKDIIAYLRLINNHFDLVSFRRSVNIPTRGVGPVTMALIEASIPEGSTALEGLETLIQSSKLRGKPQRELAKYINLFNQAADKTKNLTLSKLVRWIIVESGYRSMLEEEATIEAESRVNNLEEFISAALEVERIGLGLSEFLDRISLSSDTDKFEEKATLSLMTIHCAKGLEFPIVFVIGMEEDIFPNKKALETTDGLEEERRLFYVAITRAQHKLYLTASKRRFMMGKESLCLPSRFLKELPTDGIELSTQCSNDDKRQIKFIHSEQCQFYQKYEKTSKLLQLSSKPNHTHVFLTNQNTTIEHSNNLLPEFLTEIAASVTVNKNNIWPKGTKIISDRFGLGVIMGFSGSGDCLTYTICFTGGEKRIMARFGTLRKAQ
jgi:DNA helicase-2/ATP-dependent DNA helicase PcrA